VCSRSLERLLKAEMHPLRQLVLQNDLAMIRHFDPQIFEVEKELYRQTKQLAAREYALLQTVPGIGENLGLTILYEIGDIQRFPTVKDFLSYCRLVKGTVASAGKIEGLRGAKLGNPYLRWAFGEAAVIAKRDPFRIRPLAQRLEAQMQGNKFKANTVLAIKLARSVYFRACPQTRQFSISPRGRGGSDSGGEVIRNFRPENSLISKSGRHSFCVSPLRSLPRCR